LDAAFSSDSGCVVTAGADGAARVWDPISAVEMAVLRGHDGAVCHAGFCPYGKRLLTTGVDGAARIWIDTTLQAWRRTLRDEGRIFNAVFSPDDRRFVVVGDAGGGAIADAVTCRETATLRGHSSKVLDVAFSPDGTRVATTGLDDGTTRIWDVVSGREICVVGSGQGRVTRGTFDPGGVLVATCRDWDDAVRLWDAQSGAEVAALGGHGGAAYLAGFSHDGRRVATIGKDRVAHVWDTASWREMFKFGGPGREVGHVQFSPDDSRLVAGSAQGQTWTIRDASSGQELVTLQGLTNIEYSPDGSRMLAVTGNNRIQVREPFGGAVLLSPSDFFDRVVRARFSSDGSRIVVHSLGAMHVYDAQSASKIATLRLGEDFAGYVNGFGGGISAEGTRIVARGRDGDARLRVYPALYAAVHFGGCAIDGQCTVSEKTSVVAPIGQPAMASLTPVRRTLAAVPPPVPQRVPRGVTRLPASPVVRTPIAPDARPPIARRIAQDAKVAAPPPNPFVPAPSVDPATPPSDGTIKWTEPRPKNEWERETGRIIVAGLQGVVGQLLSGRNIPVYQGRKRKGQIEIDHVLVAEIGMFTIECKHYPGRITGTLNGPWYCETTAGRKPIDSAGRENPSKQSSEQIYAVKNILEVGLDANDELIRGERLWVDGTVLFPDAAEFQIEHVTTNAFNFNAPVVFNASRFTKALRERANQKRLSPIEINRIVSVLQKI
ncbi:MAG: NERD domain-containing protein, partial [Alphaproteobacteria bacterium]|nr:NERD domain-containing protein [Alphaproteobacteria bacterium]